MSLFRLEILEVFEAIDSTTKESCLYAWATEAKPRRYKLKLAKANANELNIIRQNVGGVVLMNVGVMESSGEPMLYYKQGDEIEVYRSPQEMTALKNRSKTYTDDEIKKLCDDAARVALEAYQLDQMANEKPKDKAVNFDHLGKSKAA